MNVVAVQGQERGTLGKKASKSDRRSEIIPCVLYGGDQPVHFTTTGKEVKNLIYTGDFKLAELEIGGKKVKSIVKEVQFHPVTDKIMHIDFLRLIDDTPIKVELPVRFRGTSPGVRIGGKLIQNLRKVKVKTLPKDLVDHVLIDISSLELGQSIRVRDIDANEGVEIMNAPGIPVATIEIPRAMRSAATAAAKAK
ncbi:MAG: 50S ribosomal protein L25 [Saprospiraceae bacterium]|jgi:large subunit ribosomal protein L25